MLDANGVRFLLCDSEPVRRQGAHVLVLLGRPSTGKTVKIYLIGLNRPTGANRYKPYDV